MSRAGTLIAVAIMALARPAPATDWPQFRGPGMAGISDETGLPERWGPTENVRWKTVLPGRGVSSPVIVGDRVFVTACSGLNQTRLHVLCFAADTGIKLWERQFWASGPTNCNPKTCVAASTPAADRDRICCLFASGDLLCLDHAGGLRWLRTLQTDYPAMSNLVGRAASPVVCDGLVIVPMENQGASFLLGVDLDTGRNRWRVERPLENNYSTPLLVRARDKTDLVVQAKGGLTGYDPVSGAVRWEFADETVSSVASPVTADGLIVGVGREIVVLRTASAGPPEVVWRSARLGSGTPTPVVAADRIYALKDSGVFVCGDLRTGKEVWSLRVRGAYSASPVLAAGKLYLVNEDGETMVLRAGDKAEQIATNSLGESMLASPAIACGCIFLRSDKHLYCIGRTK